MSVNRPRDPVIAKTLAPWSGVAKACFVLEQLCQPNLSIIHRLQAQGKAHLAGANSLKQQPKCTLNVLCISTFHFYWGFASNQKRMWNKWKNHFSEMKGDVGMSHHEKEGEQEDALCRNRKSLITLSLHLCFSIKLPVHIYKCSNLSSKPTQNSCIAHEQRCRDGVINNFLSRYRHLLVPLLFHDMTSLHPP